MSLNEIIGVFVQARNNEHLAKEGKVMKSILLAVVFSLGFTLYSQSFTFRKTSPGIKMRYIGPGNGGSMFGMTIQPSNPNIMLFGGDMGACYRT